MLCRAFRSRSESAQRFLTLSTIRSFLDGVRSDYDRAYQGLSFTMSSFMLFIIDMDGQVYSDERWASTESQHISVRYRRREHAGGFLQQFADRPAGFLTTVRDLGSRRG